MTGTRGWTNEDAIRQWARSPREDLERTAAHGDFAKLHLLNPALRRVLGDVHGKRILDAGCGNGYLSRQLAARGAEVVGVEPALYDFAVSMPHARVRYVQADLCDLPDLGGAFDIVVASMVLQVVPDWEGAMRACVDALVPGGLFVFTLNHPCFERLASTWREHGAYRVEEYLAEYEIEGPHGVDFHRPLSAYLNVLARLGCRLREVDEPGLDPMTPEGVEAYIHLPNFLVVAATKEFRNVQARGRAAVPDSGA